MILRPPTTPTSQLFWDAPDRQYVGDISSTHGFGQVYDDACDEGMTLVNMRTGREVVFVVDRTEVRDGDIVSWTLRPLRGVCLAGCSVLLFND